MKITDLSRDAEDFTGNVWLVEANGERCLVDAGTGDSWNRIKRLDSVEKVVITHSHYDHVDNLPKVKDRFDPDIYAYNPGNLPVDAEEVEEGEKLDICGSEFEVIHTPGHRDDSICLYSFEYRILFAGDLLFPDGGFGRTDLEEGDRELLIDSIRKIVDLDVEEMYCGHDPAASDEVNRQIKESLEEAEKHEPKY